MKPVDADPSKPQILPYEEADNDAVDDGDSDEADEEGPDDWFPGDPGDPDVIYTFGGGPEGNGEIDPVIYQGGVPVLSKVSPKEKRSNLQADIEGGCIVTYSAWDEDGNGALDLEEFSAHWPGPAKSNARAFKRIDKDGNRLITADEFALKKASPRVLPKSMGILEAAEYRATFNSLDFDGNGFLTFGEFTALLRPSGPGILEAIFAEADRNGDGKVSFAEYTHRPVNVEEVE